MFPVKPTICRVRAVRGMVTAWLLRCISHPANVSATVKRMRRLGFLGSGRHPPFDDGNTGVGTSERREPVSQGRVWTVEMVRS